MRKRFEQQTKIGRLPIQDTEILLKCRNPLLELMAALKEIFVNKKYNEQIFSILESAILKGKKKTGRKGMDLWQIFVLSQVRLCKNTTYDDLHYIANHDKLVRQIMGVEGDAGFEQVRFEYQNIYDNVSLIDDKTVKELNDVILDFGHETFKKKEGAPLRLKTDSFVVESNVHFPTDYNLLWDCARKCLDGIAKFLEKYQHIPGWRKIKNWRYELKGLMREVGKTSASGGKNKETRLRVSVTGYLNKANVLLSKLERDVPSLPINDIEDLAVSLMIEHFMRLLKKHIDLVDRRLLKGQDIPHKEKMFSVFETYTEMVKKGKSFPNVEFGKKLAITTDQYNLIIDYHMMSDETDRDIVIGLADRILVAHNVLSWSFDKGFWNKDNKELLKTEVPEVIMPKLGKRNKEEELEETSRNFRKFKNKHSAIESNINELEHRGLDRCLDRTLPHLTRYIGLAVSAYNLKKIGKHILEKERERIRLKQAA